MIIRDDSTKMVWRGAAGKRAPAAVEAWDRPDWQRMWLRTQSREWRVLALVPGDEHTSTFDVANLLVRLALDHGEAIQVADLRDVGLKHVDAILEGTRWDTSQGSRMIFATRSASANLATVPLARAADCAILCVSPGLTSLGTARDTVEQIGQEHFLGSLVVRPAGGSESRSHGLRPRRLVARARP